MYSRKLVVIGGGAAGFFCAINAARLHPGLEVVLLEKSSKILSKVKISGGGRCNVTHDSVSIADLVKSYPRGGSFLKKAFHFFFTTDTVEWFRERSVNLKTEADGRMFPISNNSQTIIDCLVGEAKKYGVQIFLNSGVEKVICADKFSLRLFGGAEMNCDFLCVASGGYSKSSQFEWLRATGHTINTPVPSLFTFNLPGNTITALMGVSVTSVSVRISGSKVEQTGPLLITHWGLSGPAILKSSSWAARLLAEQHYDYKIVVNWLPEFNENSLKNKFQQVRFDIASQKIVNRNPFGIAGRLWEYFLSLCSIPVDIRWADLGGKEQNKLIKILCGQEFEVRGKTTFKEEFVTAGGIKLEEIDPSTMQSRLVNNLYFAGEVIDVDGVTGGFNFQNAWTTGWIAAQLSRKTPSEDTR